MAQIPQAPLPGIFQPQTIKAPTEGTQAEANLFTGVANIAGKLSQEQIQADKLIGTNQIQTSIRNLQRDATLKFPGDFKSQQQFVNQGSKSFLETFIPSSHFANRSYFKALSTNLLSSANFGFAKNISAQNLQNQKQIINEQFNDFLSNTVHAIRSGNEKVTKNNIGLWTTALKTMQDGSILKPSEKDAHIQKMLSTFQVAAAKTHIDAALSEGGLDAANAKFREIASDPNNPILADPKRATTFISEIRSYKNAVTSGLKASQSANKDLKRDVLNNTRMTGQWDPQKVTNLNIEEANETALLEYHRGFQIWTSSPIDRQNALGSLKLDNPVDIAIKKTVGEFETQYKKDPTGFIFSQIAKSQFNVDLANATPEQFKQMRSAAVEIQRQRGDLQIKPMTNSEMQPVIEKALSGDPNAFLNAFNQYQQSAGKYSQSALIQLSTALKHNGVDDSVETVGYFADPKGIVPTNIIKDSTVPLKLLVEGASVKLNETPGKTKTLVESKVRDMLQKRTFFTPQREKFISSLLNSAGAKKGLALASFRDQLQRYVYGTISRGANQNVDGALSQYFDSIGDSYNYSKQRDSQFIRIPKVFEGKPLDQVKVRDFLTQVQNNLKMKDVDLSEVVGPPTESSALDRQRYWNTSGSMNSWMTGPDGESYYLKANDGLVLKSKKTGQNIRVTNSQIFNAPDTAKDLKRRKEKADESETLVGLFKTPINLKGN